MIERWRYACPEGHRTIMRRTRSGGYYCKICERGFESDPVDLKREGPAHA